MAILTQEFSELEQLLKVYLSVAREIVLYIEAQGLRGRIAYGIWRARGFSWDLSR